MFKKRKDNKLKRLQQELDRLKDENEKLRRKVFQYKLKNGEVPVPKRRPMMKVQGKKFRGAGPPR